MGDDGDDQGVSHNTDELQEAIQELKNKNVELKKVLDYIHKENSSYKQKYNLLRQKLLNLTELLEKNARIFNQLFDDAKCALQLGRVPMLNSPISQRKSILLGSSSPKGDSSTALMKSSASRKLYIEPRNVEDARNGSPKAGPSGMVTSISSGDRMTNVRVRKLHIEPLNMQDLGQIENENEEYNMQISQEEIDSPQDKLSTIIEENIKSPQLCVKLERLPIEILESYIDIEKSVPLCNNSSLNVDDSIFLESDPNFSSTPLKVDLMGRLGLVPSTKTLNNSNSRQQFVSRRKKALQSQTATVNVSGSSTSLVSFKNEKVSLVNITDNSLVNASPCRKVSSSRKANLLSPKKEKFSVTPQKENSLTESKKRQLNSPGAKVRTKRKKSTPTVSPLARSNQRPVRKARPTNLKEEQLNTKKRRN